MIYNDEAALLTIQKKCLQIPVSSRAELPLPEVVGSEVRPRPEHIFLKYKICALYFMFEFSLVAIYANNLAHS